MWFQVELPQAGDGHRDPVPVAGAGRARRWPGMPRRVSVGRRAGGGPRGSRAATRWRSRTDGTSWTAAARGAGNGPTTIGTFPPVQAKFVRISLTANADDAPAWSIQSLRIFALPQAAGANAGPGSVGPRSFRHGVRFIQTSSSPAGSMEPASTMQDCVTLEDLQIAARRRPLDTRASHCPPRPSLCRLSAAQRTRQRSGGAGGPHGEAGVHVHRAERRADHHARRHDPAVERAHARSARPASDPDDPARRTARMAPSAAPTAVPRHGPAAATSSCPGRARPVHVGRARSIRSATRRPTATTPIEWAAKLPKSNGKVGMYGFSYPGATQWLPATLRPPPLTAIVPAMTSSDYYDGWTYEGGALYQAFAESWPMNSIAQQRRAAPPDGAKLDDRIERGAEERTPTSGSGSCRSRTIPPLHPRIRAWRAYHFDWLQAPGQTTTTGSTWSIRTRWSRYHRAGAQLQRLVRRLHQRRDRELRRHAARRGSRIAARRASGSWSARGSISAGSRRSAKSISVPRRPTRCRELM